MAKKMSVLYLKYKIKISSNTFYTLNINSICFSASIAELELIKAMTSGSIIAVLTHRHNSAHKLRILVDNSSQCILTSFTGTLASTHRLNRLVRRQKFHQHITITSATSRPYLIVHISSTSNQRRIANTACYFVCCTIGGCSDGHVAIRVYGNHADGVM
ncbi:hypothetical protein BpHYR1_006290 [Brachionus plicatilis]|uniref:Uncharacterized protein n=1 Tax=Brachionus plicatilis TaxID=10195 RepID=A0A3M7RF76_BRAPC|nr:hypothetical protein BpHYR1_006290 [Brachionus plicatilis]